jgi:hypothetical protein
MVVYPEKSGKKLTWNVSWKKIALSAIPMRKIKTSKVRIRSRCNRKVARLQSPLKK